MLAEAIYAGVAVLFDGTLHLRVLAAAALGTSLEIKALMKRLDFHGLTAATTAMSRFAPVGETTAAIKN